MEYGGGNGGLRQNVASSRRSGDAVEASNIGDDFREIRQTGGGGGNPSSNGPSGLVDWASAAEYGGADSMAGSSGHYVNGSGGSGNGISDDAMPAGIGQYDDFHTIDWQRDIARDRMRHRHIIKRTQESFLERLRGAHDAWSGWLCVLLVGVTSGMIAAVIDIGTNWLSDIKNGICPSAFYLNKEQCCWSSEESIVDISGNCSLW